MKSLGLILSTDNMVNTAFEWKGQVEGGQVEIIPLLFLKLYNEAEERDPNFFWMSGLLGMDGTHFGFRTV